MQPCTKTSVITKSLVLKTGAAAPGTHVPASLFLPLVTLLGLLWIGHSGLYTEIVKSFPKFPQILAG